MSGLDIALLLIGLSVASFLWFTLPKLIDERDTREEAKEPPADSREDLEPFKHSSVLTSALNLMREMRIAEQEQRNKMRTSKMIQQTAILRRRRCR